MAHERSEPESLRVQLFGALRMEFAGTPLTIPAAPTARSVLAWLLAHPGLHARARVAAQFWPDVVDRAARASLRTALWEIRRAAGEAPWLSQSRDRVGVATEQVQDLAAFRAAVAAGGSDSLERALALARSQLLTDLADDWVLELRDEVRDLAAAAAMQLADRAEAAGDQASAIGWTRRAVREAPLDEQVHRQLMVRLAEAGERAEALVAFERLEAALMADVAFVSAIDGRARRQLALHPLSAENLVLIVAPDHPLANRRRVSVRDLRDERHVAFPEGATIREAFVAAARRAGFDPRITFESSHASRVRSLVAHGLGVAVLPESDTRSLGPAVVAVPIHDRTLVHHVLLAWRAERRLTPAAAELVRHVQTASSALSPHPVP